MYALISQSKAAVKRRKYQWLLESRLWRASCYQWWMSCSCIRIVKFSPSTERDLCSALFIILVVHHQFLSLLVCYSRIQLRSRRRDGRICLCLCNYYNVYCGRGFVGIEELARSCSTRTAGVESNVTWVFSNVSSSFIGFLTGSNVSYLDFHVCFLWFGNSYVWELLITNRKSIHGNPINHLYCL